MNASLVVLSALVAVCAGQYGIYPGYAAETWMNALAKDAHMRQWHHEAARNMGLMGRKRRDVQSEEASLHDDLKHDDKEAHDDSHLSKRQILSYGYGGYNPYYGYGGLYGGGLVRGFYGRKRRDTTDVTRTEEKDQHKRQLFYGGLESLGYGYGRGYGAPMYGGYYGRSIFGRKRRDTSGVELADGKDQVKRQIISYAGLPMTNYYGGYMPYSGLGLGYYGGYIKKRSTTEDEQSQEEVDAGQRDRRQAPMMMEPMMNQAMMMPGMVGGMMY